MSLKLEEIGASLPRGRVYGGKKDYSRRHRRQRQTDKAGGKIVGVGQGADGKLFDVIDVNYGTSSS